MANYSTLKAAINAVIKTNGQKEITGEVLNQVLNAMVTSLGTNYQYAGVATPSTNPGTPDQNVFYLATQAGTYTNFNATILPAGISILLWNGSWSSETFFTVESTPTSGSTNLVTSGGVFEKMKLDGGAYDVSAHNGGTTFASLEALLSDANLNTLIPVAIRTGGMSIRFVQTSDNNYVQYWYFGTGVTGSPNPFLNTDNWLRTDNIPTVNAVRESLIPIKGKVSIIGDNISAYANTIPSGYLTDYPLGDVASVHDMWWNLILSLSGAELDTNASCAGSRVTDTRTSQGLSDLPDFYDRTSILGNPDYIFVALGTNDSGNNISFGDFDYDSDISQLSESEFIPAYIKGVKSLMANYPNKKIVLFIFHMGNNYAWAIMDIGKHYNIPVIDVRSYYTNNYRPDKAGMSIVAQNIVSFFVKGTIADALIKENSETVTATGINRRILSAINNAQTKVCSYENLTKLKGRIDTTNNKIDRGNYELSSSSDSFVLYPISGGDTILIKGHATNGTIIGLLSAFDFDYNSLIGYSPSLANGESGFRVIPNTDTIITAGNNAKFLLVSYSNNYLNNIPQKLYIGSRNMLVDAASDYLIKSEQSLSSEEKAQVWNNLGIVVDNEPTEGSNNFVKSGGVKIQFDKYDKLNNWFLTEGIVTGKKLNASGISSGDENKFITDYIEVDKSKSIYVRGSSSSSMCCLAFYDKNKDFISGYHNSSYDNVLFEITAENIPSNAKYIRGCCSRNSIGELYIGINSSLDKLSSDAKYLMTAPAIQGIVDDTSEFVRYFNDWQHYNDGNGTNSACSTTGGYMTIRFIGTGIAIYHRSGSSRRKVKVYIDEKEYGVFDAYSASIVYHAELLRCIGLSVDIVHTIKLEVLDDKNASSSGSSGFVFDSALVINELTPVIDKTGMEGKAGFISKNNHCQIYQSTHYNYYSIPNFNFTKVIVTTDGYMEDNLYPILFFSENEINENYLISGVAATSADRTTYNAVVPENCKLIVCQQRATDNVDNTGNNAIVYGNFYFAKNVLYSKENVSIEDKLFSLQRTVNGISKNFVAMVHLDCGRKYYSPANIKLMIDAAANSGCNYFSLYFSDSQGFRFGLDDMTISANDTTYDLSIALGDGITANGKNPDGSNKWLTQTEMTNIIQYAKGKGISIVPAFDMPGHIGAILDKFPQFKRTGTDIDFDLENTSAVNFFTAVANKYISYFAANGCKYYNICGDEVTYMSTLYNTDKLYLFNDFINSISRIVMGEGMTPIVFNEAIYYGGLNDTTNTNIVSSYWAQHQRYASVKEEASMGIRMINANSNFYWTLGMPNHQPTPTEMANFDIHKFANNQMFYNPYGSCFCIWSDYADTDGADDGNNVTSIVCPVIESYGRTVSSQIE